MLNYDYTTDVFEEVEEEEENVQEDAVPVMYFNE